MSPEELQKPPTPIELAALLSLTSLPDSNLNEEGRNILRRLMFACDQSKPRFWAPIFTSGQPNNELAGPVLVMGATAEEAQKNLFAEHGHRPSAIRPNDFYGKFVRMEERIFRNNCLYLKS